MSKRSKILFALWCAVTLCGIVSYALARQWIGLMWILSLPAIMWILLRQDDLILRQEKLIQEQNEYIKEADDHIHYLTNHDTWKQIRMSEAKAKNCYHYLMRIGQLKAQNEQLRILNHNLMNNQGKGVRNYARRHR